MYAPLPPVVPRKPSGVRVMITPGGQPSAKENGAHRDSIHTSQVNAEREVEILNHCFDDVERFMGQLQQAAEAQSILSQRKKKGSRKSKNKAGQNDDLLTMKANPPSEENFVDLFQKIKYSLCLLDRLKSSISQPDAPDLLHHIFMPLRLLVNTTGGPTLGASVVSPAMTTGAVSLLQEHLTEKEKELWTSLGPNWTSSCSHLNVSVPPYSPVFLDGWQPQAYDSAGKPLEDPIKMQHKHEAFRERREAQTLQEHTRQHAEGPAEGTEEVDGIGLLPEDERYYCCSYDFVARNSSELSVLQGETLEVIDSSKRWWKCQNRFDQIGFVPSNILEPLSALNHTQRESLKRKESKTAISPRSKYFSYPPLSPSEVSPTATSPTLRPQSMVLPSTTLGEDNNKVLIMNDELLQRITLRRNSSRPLVVPRTADTAPPLNYHSRPAEVEAWLSAKGFSGPTIQSLGILTGAQLFSLNKEELRIVSPDEGARAYSQIMVQKALLENVRKVSELETAMEKQKQRISLKPEGGEF